MFSIRSLWIATSALLLMGTGHAETRPTVLELFTSEGCSSCPPAEAYLGELVHHPDVIALAYHVNYRDELGWRDPFGLREAVQRQKAYARALGRTSVYTPQAVIDGHEDFVGSDRMRIGRALLEKQTGDPVGISETAHEIVVSLEGIDPTIPSEAVLIAYEREAVSAIGRGENAGRTLREYNIVRAIRTGSFRGQATYRVERSELPPEATDIAVLLHRASQMQVTGAAHHALLVTPDSSANAPR